MLSSERHRLRAVGHTNQTKQIMTNSRYKDSKLQAAHENACDCLYYGYGQDVWNKYDLDDETAAKVWDYAKRVLAAGHRY